MVEKKIIDGKEINLETYFEFNGMQVSIEDLVQKTKEAYVADGKELKDVDSVRVYINANERRAYYIVNDEEEGKFVEF